MKVFEKIVEGERKLYGTATNDVADAVEVTLKNHDGEEVEFDFSGKYHYIAPGSFGGEDGEALGMFIGDVQVVPRGIDFEIPASLDIEEDEQEEGEPED